MKAYQNKHSAMVSFEYARSFLDSNDGKILPAWIGMEGTITKREFATILVEEMSR